MFYRRLLLACSFAIALQTAPAQAQPQLPQDVTIGVSGQGRPITAVRFGTGPRKLVVIGATHGFPERNTYALSLALIEHFRANPADLPPSLSLYIIPVLNPDGLVLGTRFNGRGVDLNRNMNTNLDPCSDNDWSPVVQGAYGLVAETGGPFADSEVESRVIKRFLLNADGAIFLHSNAGLVFPASCEHAPSIAMAQVYARGAGYEYSRYWPRYSITGGMHDWAGSLGIASITPELITGDQPEVAQNLGGLLAVIRATDDLLQPQGAVDVQGVAVPVPLWRFWRAYGGEPVLGLPLSAATSADGSISQLFTRALLTVREKDGAVVVQAGEQQVPGRAYPPAVDAGERLFAETGHTLRAVFLRFWERNDGATLLGAPISEEFDATALDGQRRTRQVFERGVLAYYPEDGSARLEPLGWASLIRERVVSTPQAQMIR